MDRRPSILRRRDRSSQKGSRGVNPWLKHPGMEEADRAETYTQERCRRQPVVAPNGSESSVFVEGSLGLEAFKRALTVKDKEIMPTFSLEEVDNRFFRETAQVLHFCITLSAFVPWEAHVFLKPWFLLSVVFRPWLSGHYEDEGILFCLESTNAEAEREVKAHGITTDEKQKLSVELMETKFENNRLTVKLQASKRERAQERVEGLSTLIQTSELNKILKHKIYLHITSEEVKVEIARY
ncbi:hypothetical protein U1Q18_031670 [Sarracenia purpurea var. burkii]